MKDHTLIGALAALILALCCVGVARAQEPPGTRPTACHMATPANAACIVWTAPTLNDDGTPIVLALTYRVERQAGTGWAAVATTSELRHYVTGLAPGTHTFRVVAIAGGRESLPSNTGARDVPQPAPLPPVIQVVRVVVDSNESPVFTVLANGTRSNTFAGLATVGTECTGPELFRYLGVGWRAPVTWNRRVGISASARVAAPCS